MTRARFKLHTHLVFQQTTLLLCVCVCAIYNCLDHKLGACTPFQLESDGIGGGGRWPWWTGGIYQLGNLMASAAIFYGTGQSII